jgi:long-chain acyl-CoA synthetase
MIKLNGADITSDQLLQKVAGRTIPSLFVETVNQNGDAIALRAKDRDGEFYTLTWREYADRAARVATALASYDVKPGDRVVLMLKNRPEFHVADMGVLLAGATPISIYNSSAPEQIAYVINSAEAKLVIVDGTNFLDKVLSIRDHVPTLKHLVICDTNDETSDSVVSFDSLLESEPVDLAAAASRITPEQTATIIYTSGTTGPPKGVVLTHQNICFALESYCIRATVDLAHTTAVSYLPMAHQAERTLSHYMAAYKAMEITCCPEPTQLTAYLGAVHPTILFGVPRVFEKAYNGVNAFLSLDPEKRDKFNEGIEAARPIVAKLTRGEEVSDDERGMYEFLDAVAFKQVRELLGLDKIILAASGAAPCPPHVLEWFRIIGLNLSEIYGMSESSITMTWSPSHLKPSSVGPAMPGVELRLADDGEILTRGAHVFGGYYNDTEKTAETLDADGWLHTGDVGVLDEDGYLTIIDRKKELIITAGGKNISPSNIESSLKRHPLISQACVIGDNRPYISALLVIDAEAAPGWAAANGVAWSTMPAFLEESAVTAEISRFIKDNNQAFSNVEQVKKWTLLGDEWLPDGDELTPTSKLKRRSILTKYLSQIESMY